MYKLVIQKRTKTTDDSFCLTLYFLLYLAFRYMYNNIVVGMKFNPVIYPHDVFGLIRGINMPEVHQPLSLRFPNLNGGLFNNA